MQLGVTTLGCPAWDLDTICNRTREYGFDGIDFRGLGDALDITLLPAFTTHVSETARRISDAGLSVSGISSGILICDPSRRLANLEEARRTIDVATALDARNARVFCGGDPAGIGLEASADIGRDCMEAILALPGSRAIRWLAETHDHWVRSADLRLLLERIPDPAFGVLWDMGHTPRVAGESPAQTLAALGDRLGYTHVKDAAHDPSHPLAMGDGWRYMPAGTGQLPLADAVALLKARGYEGWLVLEHEKRWHPELPEPDVAFPQFVQWARAQGV
jgi:sugar phosphate isomerase/epimerase